MLSVVSPSFNQARYLPVCLTSIARQSRFGPVDHIVMDGGSTDGSLDIIRAHAASLSFWASGPDGGQSAAINAGMSRAQGNLMTWINSDDGLADDAHAAMVASIGGHSQPAWGIGACRIIDADGALIGVWTPAKRLRLIDVVDWQKNYIMQPAVFWNRAMWDAVGPLKTSLHYAMDFDLWLRFFRVCEPVTTTREVGVHRVHADTKTSTVGLRIYHEYAQAIAEEIESLLVRARARYLLSDALFYKANSLLAFGDAVGGRAHFSFGFRQAPPALLSAWFLKSAFRLAAGRQGRGMAKVAR